MENLFLFFGEDTFSVNEKASFWQSEFCKKHGGDTNLEILEGEKINAGMIESFISSIPFLGEKRLVVVKNYIADGDPDDQKKTSAIIEKLPDFTILVFIETEGVDKRNSLFKKIKKIGKLVEFPLLTGGKLLAWIMRETKKKGFEIEEKAAITLMELVNGDLARMSNEIEKLGHFAEKRVITEKDIELLVDTTLATSIFKLTDALGTRNVARCTGILKALTDSGEDLHHTLFMIIRQFRLIIQIKDFLSHGVRKDEIARKLGAHPYVVGVTISQSNSFSFPELQTIYEELLSIDTKIKTGSIRTTVNDNRELLLALDRLLINVCQTGGPIR